MINERGLNLIKSFEGLFLHPYRDPIGIPTIGWGTTRYPNGKMVTMNDKNITEQEATRLLAVEINEKSASVTNFLRQHNISLNENEFAALVSFAYNLGPGPIVTPGRSMHDALKLQDCAKIADAFLLYNKARKKVRGRTVMTELAGLTRRRKAERDLFLLPVEPPITQA